MALFACRVFCFFERGFYIFLRRFSPFFCLIARKIAEVLFCEPVAFRIIAGGVEHQKAFTGAYLRQNTVKIYAFQGKNQFDGGRKALRAVFVGFKRPYGGCRKGKRSEKLATLSFDTVFTDGFYKARFGIPAVNAGERRFQTVKKVVRTPTVVLFE